MEFRAAVGYRGHSLGGGRRSNRFVDINRNASKQSPAYWQSCVEAA
jgi:hypothetical protein